MKTTYKYISFEQNDTFKTLLFTQDDVWICLNKNGDTLGHVSYYPHWKQHCFSPSPLAVFSGGCLADIQHFLGQVNGGNLNGTT